jgi:hypothetical protein
VGRARLLQNQVKETSPARRSFIGLKAKKIALRRNEIARMGQLFMLVRPLPRIFFDSRWSFSIQSASLETLRRPL